MLLDVTGTEVEDSGMSSSSTYSSSHSSLRLFEITSWPFSSSLWIRSWSKDQHWRMFWRFPEEHYPYIQRNVGWPKVWVSPKDTGLFVYQLACKCCCNLKIYHHPSWDIHPSQDVLWWVNIVAHDALKELDMHSSQGLGMCDIELMAYCMPWREYQRYIWVPTTGFNFDVNVSFSKWGISH